MGMNNVNSVIIFSSDFSSTHSISTGSDSILPHSHPVTHLEMFKLLQEVEMPTLLSGTQRLS